MQLMQLSGRACPAAAKKRGPLIATCNGPTDRCATGRAVSRLAPIIFAAATRRQVHQLPVARAIRPLAGRAWQAPCPAPPRPAPPRRAARLLAGTHFSRGPAPAPEPAPPAGSTQERAPWHRPRPAGCRLEDGTSPSPHREGQGACGLAGAAALAPTQGVALPPSHLSSLSMIQRSEQRTP